MMTHAYSQLYLNKVSRAVGNMPHAAVVEFGISGADFLEQFIQPGVAEHFENGSPAYIAGRSGLELFLEVSSKSTGKACDCNLIESYDQSPEYRVGWVMTHYQWYSGRTFKCLLNTIPYDELLGLYSILHEADINKSYEVFDAHFARLESPLKTARKRCGLTQKELSIKSGVSLNTIRAYEHKSKDLNKAQFNIIMRLSKTLKCDTSELT